MMRPLQNKRRRRMQQMNCQNNINAISNINIDIDKFQMQTTIDDQVVKQPIETIHDCIAPLIRPEFPKPFEETKWLVMSSCAFLIPMTYAFASSLYLYGCVSLFALLLSINHWRDAEDGVRRAIDCYMAYICFVVFVISGFIYCRGIFFYGGGAIISIIIGFFLMSDYLSIQHHHRWYVAHMFFHLFVTIGECFIIYCVVQQRDPVENCIAPSNP